MKKCPKESTSIAQYVSMQMQQFYIFHYIDILSALILLIKINSKSTLPCMSPGLLTWVPASARVKVKKSPLPDRKHCGSHMVIFSSSDVKLMYTLYFALMC